MRAALSPAKVWDGAASLRCWDTAMVIRSPLQSFANNGDENLSPMRRAAMFEKENALPRPELHLSISDGHGLARARQNHADV